MKTIDLYEGYEGYGELKVTHKDMKQLLVLDYDFGEVLKHIPLSTDYNKNSMMYNYLRAGEGWFEAEEWECKRVQEFYEQLKAIDINLVKKLEVYEGLIEVCDSALKNDSSIFISLE